MGRWVRSAMLAALVGGSSGAWCEPVPRPSLERAEATTFVSVGGDAEVMPDGSIAIDHALLAYETNALPPRYYRALRVTVATEGFVDFRVQWSAGGELQSARRLDGPSDVAERNFMAQRAERYTGSSEDPAAYGRTVDRILQGGQPVWWPSGERLGSSRSEVTLSLLVPVELVPGTLRVHTVSPNPEAPTGAPLELPIKLASFEVAVLGDSLLWGQGLVEAAKTTTLLRDELAQRLQRDVRMQIEAHSGAIVGDRARACTDVDVPGEVPRPDPTLWCQLESLESRGEHWDLLVVQGCINDVDPAAVVTGVGVDGSLVSEQQLRERIDRLCDQRTERLLRRARQVAPRATILVIGYPWIVSERSRSPCSDIVSMPRLLNIAFRGLRGLADSSNRSEQFQRESDDALLRAVRSADEGRNRAAFVRARGFDATRAAFARSGVGPLLLEDTAWLSGLDCIPCEPSVSGVLCPEWDDAQEKAVQVARFEDCREHYRVDQPQERVMCMLASGLHPNEIGARAYHELVVEALERRGMLPPRTPSPPPSPTACTYAGDCSGSQWCIGGTCGVPPGRGCRGDGDCTDGLCMAQRNVGTQVHTLGPCGGVSESTPGLQCHCVPP